MLVDGKLGWNSFFLRFVILQPKHSCLEIEKHFYNLHIQVLSIKFQDYLSNAIQNLCKYIFLKCFLHSPPCSSSGSLSFTLFFGFQFTAHHNTTTAKFLDYSFKPPRKFVFFREIAVSQLSRALKFHIAPQDTWEELHSFPFSWYISWYLSM